MIKSDLSIKYQTQQDRIDNRVLFQKLPNINSPDIRNVFST